MAKGAITAVNLYALGRMFGETAEAGARAPNQVDPTSAPHLRRCLKAGLLEVDKHELVLTPAGAAALRGGEPDKWTRTHVLARASDIIIRSGTSDAHELIAALERRLH